MDELLPRIVGSFLGAFVAFLLALVVLMIWNGREWRRRMKLWNSAKEAGTCRETR
jgi:uncharacterized membrane protein YccC